MGNTDYETLYYIILWENVFPPPPQDQLNIFTTIFQQKSQGPVPSQAICRSTYINQLISSAITIDKLTNKP